MRRDFPTLNVRNKAPSGSRLLLRNGGGVHAARLSSAGQGFVEEADATKFLRG